MSSLKWLLAGLVVGGLLSYGVVKAQSLPQFLLFGRTVGAVNVPVLVNDDGTLHIQ